MIKCYELYSYMNAYNNFSNSINRIKVSKNFLDNFTNNLNEKRFCS